MGQNLFVRNWPSPVCDVVVPLWPARCHPGRWLCATERAGLRRVPLKVRMSLEGTISVPCPAPPCHPLLSDEPVGQQHRYAGVSLRAGQHGLRFHDAGHHRARGHLQYDQHHGAGPGPGPQLPGLRPRCPSLFLRRPRLCLRCPKGCGGGQSGRQLPSAGRREGTAAAHCVGTGAVSGPLLWGSPSPSALTLRGHAPPPPCHPTFVLGGPPATGGRRVNHRLSRTKQSQNTRHKSTSVAKPPTIKQQRQVSCARIASSLMVCPALDVPLQWDIRQAKRDWLAPITERVRGSVTKCDKGTLIHSVQPLCLVGQPRRSQPPTSNGINSDVHTCKPGGGGVAQQNIEPRTMFLTRPQCHK